MKMNKKLKKGQVIIDVTSGVEGPSLYIGDNTSGHRLAGPKPWGGGHVVHLFIVDADELRQQLDEYAPQPQRQWVGLTHEEIEIIEALKAPPVHPDFLEDDDWMEFARAIEAKLKEKNFD